MPFKFAFTQFVVYSYRSAKTCSEKQLKDIYLISTTVLHFHIFAFELRVHCSQVVERLVLN